MQKYVKLDPSLLLIASICHDTWLSYTKKTDSEGERLDKFKKDKGWVWDDEFVFKSVTTESKCPLA